MKGPNEIPSFDHKFIHYPQSASTKFDGFRCLNLCGERALSPNLKDIRNTHLPFHLEEFFAECKKHRLVTDGELWSPTRGFHMEDKEEGISSILTTHDRFIPDDISYYVFDLMSEEEWDNGTEKPFINRYLNYKQILYGFPNVRLVEQHYVTNHVEAEEFFEAQLAAGHEGMILRSQTAKYKHGRCTMRQDGMWKFKEFITHDAVIVGVEEQMKLKPGVERTRNELGHLERRFEQDLYEPAGMVGSFNCTSPSQETPFKVKPGRGHGHTWKRNMWEGHTKLNNLIGKHIEYLYMPHGTLNKPRIGRLVRFRTDLD
jgi:ATP dependent DNA ligase domain